MRIAISGTANMGKSTLISDMIATWPSYTTETFTYRSNLKDKNHSSKTNKDTQWDILNQIVDGMGKYKKGDKVVFDRCSLDNLVYTMWAYQKQTSDIDKDFVDKCIPIVKNSLKNLDMIIFLPITKAAPVAIVDNGTREVDPVYIKEIDNLFKALTIQYKHNFGRNPFFPSDDCPGVVEIFGNPQERIAMLKYYLDVDGDLIGGHSANFIDPSNKNEMVDLLKTQEAQHKSESAYKAELEKIKEFKRVNKMTGSKFF